MLSFIGYVKFMKPIGTVRSKNIIIHNRLEGNDTIESLLKYTHAGRRTAKDILNLQRKYNKKLYCNS